MKKMSFLLAVLIPLSAGFTFAEGMREDTSNQPYGAAQSGWNYTEPEIISVTGTIHIEEGAFMPELKTEEGKSYELMVPRYYTYNSDITEGDTITIEGFEVPGPRWNQNSDTTHLAVTKAVIDGKEIVLEHRPYAGQPMAGGYYGRGGYGKHGGRMGGPRGGMGGSYGYAPKQAPGYAPRGQAPGSGRNGYYPPQGNMPGPRW